MSSQLINSLMPFLPGADRCPADNIEQIDIIGGGHTCTFVTSTWHDSKAASNYNTVECFLSVPIMFNRLPGVAPHCPSRLVRMYISILPMLLLRPLPKASRKRPLEAHHQPRGTMYMYHKQAGCQAIRALQCSLNSHCNPSNTDMDVGRDNK